MVDGLELERAGDAVRVALFDVEGGGEPQVGLDVGAPAIKVIELAVVLFGAGEVSVEADYVAIAGLDPDASEEASESALPIERGDVEYGGGSGPEEVVADEAEHVVLAIEVIGVHEQHLDEALLMEGQLQTAAEAGEEGGGVLDKAELAIVPGALGGGVVDLISVIIDDLAELHATQEVLVRVRNLSQDSVGAHVLDVSLHQRRAVLDGLHDFLLASDGLVDQSVLAGGQLARGQNVLLGLLLADERDRCQGRECGGDDGCQQKTGGGLFPEDHDFKLLRWHYGPSCRYWCELGNPYAACLRFIRLDSSSV